MDKLVRSSRVFVYSIHPRFPRLPWNYLQRPSVTILVFIYFVSFVPRYCLLLVGHESPTCMDIYPSAPWKLYYQSHGLIAFNHNAILSSVALESHAVTSDRMLNMVKRDRTGHLDTLKNKCEGKRSIIFLHSLQRLCHTKHDLVTEMLQSEQRTWSPYYSLHKSVSAVEE